MKVLAIESTCDETAASVVESPSAGSGLSGVKVLSSVVASSAKIHEKYGGVVPEVASREQVKSIIPVITEALGETNTKEVDAIAVSFGPGLMGSLLIGVETAKVLAWVFDKPLLKVNHVSAHLMANWLTEEDNRTPEMPAIGLVASGGHTDFVYIKSLKDWEWIGGTRDDAAGEAFDKVARAFGLAYPGGPEIDKEANRVSDEDYGKLRKEERLPRPLINDGSLEMSFSGLKAAVTRLDLNETNKGIYIRDFAEAVTEVLVKKTKLAMEKYEVKSVLLAGGVAANTKIREAMKKVVEEEGLKFFVPELKYCGDNAAMIGASAVLNPQKASYEDSPDPGMSVV